MRPWPPILNKIKDVEDGLADFEGYTLKLAFYFSKYFLFGAVKAES